MMSIEAMSGAGQGSYYIDLAREDYYLEGGEPPGRWFGKGAKSLELSGSVEKEEFRQVLQGFSPDGKNELVQNAGKENRQSGWDVTFSAPKSVSTVWSQADESMRQDIQEAHREAVESALSYLEENAAFTRRGKGGLDKEEAGLVVATFEHGTSRAQDPQLHTHALVLNTGTRADGTTGTIESKPLYQHKMAAGAIYRAELASQLEQRLGFEIERDKFSFTIKGVDKGLIEEFSTRRKEIEEVLSEKGFTSAKAAGVAALNTREVKEHIARDTLFERWKAVGQEFGWGNEQASELKNEKRPERNINGETSSAIKTAISRITDHDNTFTKRDLVRFTAEESQGRGVGAKDILSAVNNHLQTSTEIVPLGRVGDELRYTTREILELESRMMGGVGRLNTTSGNGAIKPEVVQSVLSERPILSDQQKAAVHHITETPGQIKAVSGMAGTGKSYCLNTAREIWEREGYQALGATLSGKAAQGLEEGAGIKSETIHRTLSQLRSGSLKLNDKSIIVVDEAGMVGTRQMAELIERVEQSNSKIVLVGDAKQLQPVDAGGPFKAISEKIGFAELTEIRRQREDWARDAVHKIAGGEAGEMLKSYAERGLLFVGKDRNDMLERAFQDWKRGGIETPKEHLILAGTNQDIRKLNDRAQQERFSAGKLGSDTLRVNGETIFEGDRVLFTRNSRMYGVKNGTLGMVEKVDRKAQTLTARLDSGEKTTISLKHYDHVKLGYAVTTHKSQGMTVENSYVVLGGAMQDRELSYVQASRARGTTRLYTEEAEAGENLKEISKKMNQTHQKGLAMEHKQENEKEVRPQLKQTQQIGM